MVIAKHAVTDQAKLARMIADMQAGWPASMPPVLVAGDNEALTGSHRIAAARIAGIEVVTLDIQDAIDALVEQGYDWEEMICMDDDQLARAFQAIGRRDLATLAH